MPTLADALDLAAAGWEVLPLNGKVPVTAHGVKDATTDADRITSWWLSGGHNIGARVPAHLVVIDIDPQNGGSLAAIEQLAGPLPRTLTVHSGRRTGGQHRYYRHPGGSLSASRLPDGIDVKTARGYCVVPPSVHPLTGYPYTWEEHPPAAMPARLIELLRSVPPRRPVAVVNGRHAQRARYLAQYVEQLREGQRNAGLFWAACRAVEDGHPQETFDLLLAAAIVAGLSEAEAQRTIGSALRRPGSR